MKKIALILLTVMFPLLAASQKSVVQEYVSQLNKYCAQYDRITCSDLLTLLTYYDSNDEEVYALMRDEITSETADLCYKGVIDTKRDCKIFNIDVEAMAYVQCFKWLGIKKANILSIEESSKSRYRCVTVIIEYSGGEYGNGHVMGQDFIIDNGRIRRIENNKTAYDAWRDGDNRQTGGESSGGSSGSHQYVDLGIGTLWATSNVGATNAWDYGDYFAWGETEPKSTYSWSNYKYGNGSDDKFAVKKYNKTDSRAVIVPSDDAATSNWGREWRMPTADELNDLISKCYWVWTTNYKGHNCNGYIVYKALKESDKGVKIYEGKKADAAYSTDRVAHIFLPAAGLKGKDRLHLYAGANGSYWSSSLIVDTPTMARLLYFTSSRVEAYNGGRLHGHSVRPVRCR